MSAIVSPIAIAVMAIGMVMVIRGELKGFGLVACGVCVSLVGHIVFPS